MLVALISTAAFSEYVSSFLSLRASEPNWAGSTYQPGPGLIEAQFFDSWILKSSGGRANAIVKKDDPGSTSRWTAQGYLHHGVLAVSYASEKPESFGIGGFYLQQVGNKQEYRGRQVFFDCDAQKTLSCPYILVPAQGRELLNSDASVAYLKAGCKEAEEQIRKTCGR